MSAVAPQRYKIGEARLQKSSENRTEAKSAPQKGKRTNIFWPFSSSRRPSVRAARLAPPTANRLDTAVSIRNTEETTVTAAVCRGSFRSPTKIGVGQTVNQHNHLADNCGDNLLEKCFAYRHLFKQIGFIRNFCHTKLPLRSDFKPQARATQRCKSGFSRPALFALLL